MKKVYTPAFKAHVAFELITEEKTLAQRSAQYGVHANVVRDWRAQALKGLPTVFERHNAVADLKATHAQQVEDLYAQIGRLTTQYNGPGNSDSETPECRGDYRYEKVLHFRL